MLLRHAEMKRQGVSQRERCNSDGDADLAFVSGLDGSDTQSREFGEHDSDGHHGAAVGGAFAG